MLRDKTIIQIENENKTKKKRMREKKKKRNAFVLFVNANGEKQRAATCTHVFSFHSSQMLIAQASSIIHSLKSVTVTLITVTRLCVLCMRGFLVCDKNKHTPSGPTMRAFSGTNVNGRPNIMKKTVPICFVRVQQRVQTTIKCLLKCQSMASFFHHHLTQYSTGFFSFR